MEENKNYGVLLGQRNTDYLAGALPYEERNPSGDWTNYLPNGEWQRNHIQDTMACVSFSALNSIETQIKFLIGESVNFSDRFTATMSGTTKQGNYLWKVADSIRQDGAVLESDYPAPQNYNWDSYYSAVPIEIINKGKDFLKNWVVQYEWIEPSKESLMHHLKQAPIQVVIPGHAILGFWCNEQIIKYFDSYEPFQKQTQSVTHGFKIVLKPIGDYMLNLLRVKGDNRIYAQIGEDFYWVTSDRMLHAGIGKIWEGWDQIKEVDAIDSTKVLGTFNKEY